MSGWRYAADPWVPGRAAAVLIQNGAVVVARPRRWRTAVLQRAVAAGRSGERLKSIRWLPFPCATGCGRQARISGPSRLKQPDWG
jgi:hypothetical protein